jgi:hypothetical protein
MWRQASKEVYVLASLVVDSGAYACVLGRAVGLGQSVTKSSAYLLEKNSIDIDNTPFGVKKDPNDSKHTAPFDGGVNPWASSIGLLQPVLKFRLADFPVYRNRAIESSLMASPDFCNSDVLGFGRTKLLPNDLGFIEIMMSWSHHTGYGDVWGRKDTCFQGDSTELYVVQQ